MKTWQVLALPALALFAVFVGLIGGNTSQYQCKYVEKVEVLVADHEKYTDAAYAIHYSDGTIGADNNIGSNGPVGLSRGAVCRTVFNWGFPFSWTNRGVTDESVVRR